MLNLYEQHSYVIFFKFRLMYLLHLLICLKLHDHFQQIHNELNTFYLIYIFVALNNTALKTF